MLRAISNPLSKKIFYCKEGSLFWYHEQKHILFFNSGRGITHRFLEQKFLQVTIVFLVFHSLYNHILLAFGSLITLFIFFALILGEEVLCWSYAIKQRRLKNG